MVYCIENYYFAYESASSSINEQKHLNLNFEKTDCKDGFSVASDLKPEEEQQQ